MSEPADTRRRPGRLGIGVVGAGRVGTVLACALRAAGHAVVGAATVSRDSRDRVEVLLPGVPVLDVPQVVERSELVLVTVPDDALPGLVEGLAATGAWHPGQLVVHTSGRHGTAVLDPARARGAIPLAVHPALTFTGTSVDLSRMAGACFGVTAPGPVLPVAQALVVEMGGEPVVVAEQDRALYHAALAHGSHHLVTLVAQATGLLGRAGVEDPARMLGPLLSAALDGALRRGDAALSGPVSTGDSRGVAADRAALEEDARRTGSAEVLETYRVLARATAERALASGRLGAEDGERLRTALSDHRDGRGRDRL